MSSGWSSTARLYTGGMTEWRQIEFAGMMRFNDVRQFAEIDSTNTALMEMARSGAAEGIVLVADHQLAGKGRLGRSWQAPPGASLLTSVLLRPPLGPEHAHLFTMAAAIAAVDVCETMAGIHAELKWPNDLVIEQAGVTRKLAGLLAESVTADGRLQALVIGMGLNVCWPDELPDELADIAVALNHVSDVHVDRLELLGKWLGHLDELYTRIIEDTGREIPRLLGLYRDRCSTLGREVRVELANQHLEGRALDVTDLGHLLVEVEADIFEVAAGDVIHLRPGGPDL